MVYRVKDCPICLNKINRKMDYCVTECKHEFCLNCLLVHLITNEKEDCPMCRNKLVIHEYETPEELVEQENENARRRIIINYNSSLFTHFGGLRGPICFFIQTVYVPCAVGSFTVFLFLSVYTVYNIGKQINNLF